MKKKLSKSRLAIILSGLKGFKEPKVRVEQYAMEPEIGAEVLWSMAFLDKIEGKVSVDLGSGTGILGLGMLILGAKTVYFVEADSKALEIAKNNYKMLKSESLVKGKAIFKHMDIAEFNKKADLLVQNPPFGTKIKHIDKLFLEKAIKIAPIVYSFHKSESLGFIRAFCADNGFNITYKWDFNMCLKQTLKFHRKRIYRVKVSCFRLEKEKLYK